MKNWLLGALIFTGLSIAYWIVSDQAYTRGRISAMQDKIYAYESGKEDALRDMKNGGIELSSVCAAWWFSADIQQAKKRICNEK